jgi:AAA+ ATPase superfamily predicted ATPase
MRGAQRCEGLDPVYGRRKTGKTTLVANCVKYDYYVLIVDKNRAITGESIVSTEIALREAKGILNRGGVVVIDEFGSSGAGR